MRSEMGIEVTKLCAIIAISSIAARIPSTAMKSFCFSLFYSTPLPQVHGLSGRYLMDQLRQSLCTAFALPEEDRIQLALTARKAAQSGACFPIKGWGAALRRVYTAAIDHSDRPPPTAGGHLRDLLDLEMSGKRADLAYEGTGRSNNRRKYNSDSNETSNSVIEAVSARGSNDDSDKRPHSLGPNSNSFCHDDVCSDVQRHTMPDLMR